MGDGHYGCDHEHTGGHGHEEALKRVTVTLEEEQVEKMKELASEYRVKLGQNWTLSAMMRVAVGDFLNKMGKIT